MTQTLDEPATEPLDRDHPLLESIRGIPVLDVDTHLTEPADLWTSRAPAKYKDLVPRVVQITEAEAKDMVDWKPGRGANGHVGIWAVGEDTRLGFAGGASVVNKANEKVKGSGWIQWPLTEVSPAASFVGPRLATMDAVGIWGQIVYPNAVGFGGQRFGDISDPELRRLCLTIWNDAMADMAEESGGRLQGMAVIPWWDVDVAVAEIERVAGLGLKGVNLNSDPHNQGLPDLSDAFYQPMWEACAAYDLPVNFHIGSSVSQASYFGTSPRPSLPMDNKLAIGSAMLYIGNARILANLIFSGLLERNPTLKFVSVESGVGWIPFILDALDYHCIENDVQNLSMKPSDYFRRQLYSCFWFEGGSTLLSDIDRLGTEHRMFETDFPHPTCLYPQPLNGIASTFAEHDVPMETRRKLLGGNAAKLYNIDLPERW